MIIFNISKSSLRQTGQYTVPYLCFMISHKLNKRWRFALKPFRIVHAFTSSGPAVKKLIKCTCPHKFVFAVIILFQEMHLLE